MNYKKVLQQLGLTEGKDFALTAESFEMLQQSRMVPSIIHHAEVAATFDEQGAELTPAIPAYDEIEKIHHEAVAAVLDVDGTVLVEEVPAYDEDKMVEELFILPAPSAEALAYAEKQIAVAESDMAMLVSKFLEGKESLRDEDDCINIVDNQIYSWSFKNIPCPTFEELYAGSLAISADQYKQSVLVQISELEAQITPRRLREAVLSGDKSFIESVDAQILVLRASL